MQADTEVCLLASCRTGAPFALRERLGNSSTKEPESHMAAECGSSKHDVPGYKLTSTLGKGSFGTVRRAVDVESGLEVRPRSPCAWHVHSMTTLRNSAAGGHQGCEPQSRSRHRRHRATLPRGVHSYIP